MNRVMRKLFNYSFFVILFLIVLILATSSVFATNNTTKYKFAVVPPAVHPFYGNFPQALKDVARDLNIPEPALQFPQHFNQIEQNEILDGFVARGYKGIALQPSEPTAANEQISKMVKQGVNVVLFGASTPQPTDAIFFIGDDYYDLSYKAAKYLAEALGGKGNIVHLTGMIADANTRPRIKAIEDVVNEYPDLKLLQTIADMDVTEVAQNVIGSLLAAKSSEIDGIICTAYVPSVTVATQFRQLNEQRIKAVLIDTDKAVLDAIRDGYVLMTLAKNSASWPYLAIYSLKLFADGYTWKKDSPFFIKGGTVFVNSSNIDNLEQEFYNNTKQLQENWVKNYFNPPNK